MSIGNVGLSNSATQLTPVKLQQTPPVSVPVSSKAAEEANESQQERVKEASKGGTIDTFA
jgi:hypothetical protein